MDTMKSLAIIIGVSLLMMVGLYIFPSIIFLFPVAFIVIGVKYTIRDSFLSILLTSFLIGISVDIISGLIMLAVFGTMALYIADSIIKRKKSVEIILPSALILFIASGIVFLMLRGFSDISLIDQVQESLNNYTQMQLELIEDMELTNIEAFRIRETANDISRIIISILPSIMIVMSVVISYANYYLSIVILRKLGLGIRDNPRFSRFSLPNNFIIGSLVMFLLVYLLGNLDAIPTDLIQMNLVVLIASLLYIQGISVLDFLLVRRVINIVIRIIIIGITLFASPLITFLIIVGLVDLLFDFRKLRKAKL